MRTSTRRTMLVGAAAGLSLTLVAPAVSANASGTHRSDSQHRVSTLHGSEHKGFGHLGGKGGHQASTQAAKDLRQALRTANQQFRTDVHAAKDIFKAATAGAKTAVEGVVRTSTVPADIKAAWVAYAAAIAGPKATLDTSVAAATAARVTATEAAYAAYDTATASPDAAANAKYRADVRTASADLMTATTNARTAFEAATIDARAAKRAAINVAVAAYQANPVKDDAARTALHSAIEAAQAAFDAAPGVSDAKTTRDTAVHTARDAFRAAITTARTVYAGTTGHQPSFRGLMSQWKH